MIAATCFRYCRNFEPHTFHIGSIHANAYFAVNFILEEKKIVTNFVSKSEQHDDIRRPNTIRYDAIQYTLDVLKYFTFGQSVKFSLKMAIYGINMHVY